MQEIRTNKDKILRTLQQMELELLEQLDRICRNNNIEYSLGGGTCLGQVRHGGFIPWDDDIDIDMTRENYDKFMEAAERELDKSKYVLRYRDGKSRYLRTSARMEFCDSAILTKKWQNSDFRVGVFIDIFQWNYLPNNFIRRKIISTLYFYTRCIENYKVIGSIPAKANKTIIPLLEFIGKNTTDKSIVSFEAWLLNRVHGTTGWITDDAVIHGNHMGYPSRGADSFEDVKFENLIVRNKVDTHPFLESLYGDNYMEWLPPEKRISHHNWTDVYLGKEIEATADIPDNYSDYISVRYNYDKLRRMKEVSLDITRKVYDICNRHNLRCYIIGVDEQMYHLGIHEQIGNLFCETIKLAMEMDDYRMFCKLAQDELGKRYFVQNKNTEPCYAYEYTRIRLNKTNFKDSFIPHNIETRMHDGIYVCVIPLVHTSDEIKTRERHIANIVKCNSDIITKWKNSNINRFYKASIAMKLKYVLLKLKPDSVLRRKLDAELNRYSDSTEYFCGATGSGVKKKYYSQRSLREAEVVDYLGIKALIPMDYREKEDIEVVSKQLKGIARALIKNLEIDTAIVEYKEQLCDIVKKNIHTVF